MRHLEEEQESDPLNVSHVAQPVVPEDVGEVPGFADNLLGVGTHRRSLARVLSVCPELIADSQNPKNMVDACLKCRYPLETLEAMRHDGVWRVRTKPFALGETMMTKLRCKLYPGQFSTEYAVVVEAFDGRRLSLFASHDDVETEGEPTESNPTDGWLNVRVVDRQGGIFLVRLPQSTIENGQHISVRQDQLRHASEAIGV